MGSDAGDDDDPPGPIAAGSIASPAPGSARNVTTLPAHGNAAPVAYAETLAPSTPRIRLAMTSEMSTLPLRAASAIESETTLAAPAPATLPALPLVAAEHYRADREIARGGMGRIVAAEDQRLGRAVALKELLDPQPEQIGRFQREALITARLQHPGIVPVYEAGRWPSGEPFFAMKLVSGRPLDRVIAEAATLARRLELLPRVLAATDAIAYAHSQRVVHRDLKPANILIGDFGETVVIDWGLAKNLDEESHEGAASMPAARPSRPAVQPSIHGGAKPIDTSGSRLTVDGAVMGTPAYMAPEQARGASVDQRADVFALGAMLYHLLAGAPPYNARTATDVIAAAAQGRVVPLADREPDAPPDLVAIVHRAMAQLPDERYANASELATELRRFLNGQLVAAHHYTPAQHIDRFVRRHRAAVTIGALAVVAFAAGGTFAFRRVMRERDAADHARHIADARRDAAEHLIDRMQSDMQRRLSRIGRLDLLASLGNEIREYYGALAHLPGDMNADDVDRMVGAIELVGLVQRDTGKLDLALATLGEARAQLAASAGSRDGERARIARRMIARLDFEVGTIHQQRGKLDLALPAFKLAERELAELLEQSPNDRDVLLGAADAHDRLGDLARNDGKVDDAYAQYNEAKTERERAAASPSSRPNEELAALSTSHLKLGSVFQARGEVAKALEEYRAALKLREQVAAQHEDVEAQNKVLEVQLTLGDLQRAVGDPTSAIATYNKALPVVNALTRRDPTNTTWRRLRGNLEADYGFALLDLGDHRAALDELGVAIATQQELVAKDPESTTWRGDLSRSYTRAGDAALFLGDYDRSLGDYRLALEIRRELTAKDPRSAPYRRSMAWSHYKLGNAYASKLDGRPPAGGAGDAAHAAIEAHEQALVLRQQLVDEAPAQAGFRNELASSQAALGRLLAASDPTRSRGLVGEALTSARALIASAPINNEFKETFVQALLAQADIARAPRDRELRSRSLREARDIARTAVAQPEHNVHWPLLLAEAEAGLAELAQTRGDTAGAAAAWAAVREQLEPLAKANRLAVQRKPLLARARR